MHTPRKIYIEQQIEEDNLEMTGFLHENRISDPDRVKIIIAALHAV